MTAKRYLGLDGLRGVCALTVLLYHCKNFFYTGPALPHGFLAVDVFFILSGFVIALVYEEKLNVGNHTLQFLSNRARRLLPTYWLGAILNVAIFLGVAAAGILFTGDAWWMIWLFVPFATFFMVPDFITPDGTLYPGMEGVTWSLFLEWIAYLVYASGAFRFRTSTLLTVVLWGWAAMAAAGYYTGEGWGAGGTRPTLFTIGVLRCIPAFAAGVVIYRIHTHPRFQRLPVVSPAILFAVWLGISALPGEGPTPTLDAFVVIAICPVLVMLLVRSDHKASTVCRRLGDLSYPLYVAHPGIILLAHYTSILGHRFGTPRPLNGLFVVGLCIGTAWMIMKAAPRLPIFRSRRDWSWQQPFGGVQHQTTTQLG